MGAQESYRPRSVYKARTIQCKLLEAVAVFISIVLITIGSYFCLGLPDAMLVNVYNKQ